MSPTKSGGSGEQVEDAFAILDDLERNTPDEIRKQRAHFRLSVKAPVIVVPGNASDRAKLKVKGVTGDVSAGGCSALCPIPIPVGDVFRLQFDRAQLDLPTTYARCVRCRVIREDAYECGFAFFAPISLPETAAATACAELLD